MAILLVIFTLQNAINITISLFFWEIKDAPLVLVLVSCLLLGYLIATFYFIPKQWKLKRDYNQLVKSNRELKKQLDLDQQQKKAESDISTHPEGIELEDDQDYDNPFFKD